MGVDFLPDVYWPRVIEAETEGEDDGD